MEDLDMPGIIIPFEGKTPKIAESAFIAPTAVVIGDVEIGDDAGVWFGCVLRGDVNEIRIQAATNIQDGTIIHVNSQDQGTYIGRGVTIGHMALIHACTLEDGCFIGMNATVMDGAVVEHGAVVAAGAVVTPGKRVKSGEVWGGLPAKYMKDVGAAERDMIAYTGPHYVELARRHRQGHGHDLDHDHG